MMPNGKSSATRGQMMSTAQRNRKRPPALAAANGLGRVISVENTTSQPDDQDDNEASRDTSNARKQSDGNQVSLPTQSLSLPTQSLSLPTQSLSLPTQPERTDAGAHRHRRAKRQDHEK